MILVYLYTLFTWCWLAVYVVGLRGDSSTHPLVANAQRSAPGSEASNLDHGTSSFSFPSNLEAVRRFKDSKGVSILSPSYLLSGVKMVENLKRRKLTRRDALRKVMDKQGKVRVRLDNSDVTNMGGRGDEIEEMAIGQLNGKDVEKKKDKRNLNSEAWQRSSLCREVCGYCGKHMSRRVSALCSQECRWNGDSFHACFILWSLMGNTRSTNGQY